MTDLHTNASLLEKIKTSASKPMTYEEIRKQKISYVMGSLKDGSSVTVSKVNEVLSKHDGKKTAA
jgi:hypothetical protein